MSLIIGCHLSHLHRSHLNVTPFGQSMNTHTHTHTHTYVGSSSREKGWVPLSDGIFTGDPNQTIWRQRTDHASSIWSTLGVDQWCLSFGFCVHWWFYCKNIAHWKCVPYGFIGCSDAKFWLFVLTLRLVDLLLCAANSTSLTQTSLYLFYHTTVYSFLATWIGWEPNMRHYTNTLTRQIHF